MTPEELAAIRARDAQTEFYPMFTAADIIGQRPEYDRRALLGYVDALLRKQRVLAEIAAYYANQLPQPLQPKGKKT